jgi:hypothetical protein
MVLAIYQIILHLNKITECLKITTFKIVFIFDVFFSAPIPNTTDRTCKQKSWLKCACFLYKIHVTLQCIVVSALKKPHLKKTQFWKWSFSNILLFYLDVVWFDRWPEPWNFKTSHKKYGSVGRFTVFGIYVFKSKL